MAWMSDIYDALYDKNTVCVACISYGKDSLAMLKAIKYLGLPLHRIVHTEVWATKEIPADLPPMVEFKAKADKIIKEMYGIEVEHISATKRSQSVNVERERERVTRIGSTENAKRENMLGTLEASHKPSARGAKNLRPREPLTYEDLFYRRYENGKKAGQFWGFPIIRGSWCQSRLKPKVNFPIAPRTRGTKQISFNI